MRHARQYDSGFPSHAGAWSPMQRTAMPIRRTNFLTVLLVTALAVAGLCLTWAPRAHADITAPVTVNLDTLENAKDGAAGPVSTPDVLTAGRFYGIEVSGTFTTYLNKIWQRSNAHFGICGTALGSLSGPVFPSPGGATGTPAGQDAEGIFSRPWFLPCPHPLPKQYGAFKVDLGSGFAHPAANNMPSSAPHANHTYVYLVQGQGAVARFEQVDTPTGDNDGILQVTVRPATASDCNGNSQCL